MIIWHHKGEGTTQSRPEIYQSTLQYTLLVTEKQLKLVLR